MITLSEQEFYGLEERAKKFDELDRQMQGLLSGNKEVIVTDLRYSVETYNTITANIEAIIHDRK